MSNRTSYRPQFHQIAVIAMAAQGPAPNSLSPSPIVRRISLNGLF
jgi:hypothetical protein